tara:strand:+ start:333 stop:536 length:204 start_codon:yes stop_codon:yes gene_type:complete
VPRKSYIIKATGHIKIEGSIKRLEYKKIITKPVIKPNNVLPESPKKIFGNFKKETLKRKKIRTGIII